MQVNEKFPWPIANLEGIFLPLGTYKWWINVEVIGEGSINGESWKVTIAMATTQLKIVETCKFWNVINTFCVMKVVRTTRGDLGESMLRWNNFKHTWSL
jgi:hypothetical protein